MVKEKRPSGSPTAAIKHSSTLIGVLGESAISPSPFDVNTFIKKTLSNFNLVGDKTTATNEEQQFFDDKPKKEKRHGGEFSNSSSSTSKNNGIGISQANCNIEATSANKTITNPSAVSSIKKCCPYCGRYFNVPVVEEQEQRLPQTSSSLYCAECYQLFTQNSQWEIQRRLSSMADDKTSQGQQREQLPATETTTMLSSKSHRNRTHRDHHKKSTTVEDAVGTDERKSHYRQHHRRHSSAPKRYRSHHSSPVRQAAVPTTSGVRNNASEYDIVNGYYSSDQQRPTATAKRQQSPAASRRNSWSSSSSTHPTCRICHLTGELGESLITPCRCSGTMQYIHTTCLVHWLEISSKKVYPSPQCELCGYHFRTHHCYRLQRLHYPQCDHRDKVLHMVFTLMIIVMIGCAVLSGIYLRAEKGYRMKSSLTPEDVVVIACSVLFFCAFFVAVYTQYRAEASVCRLFTRCWLINKHWRVKDYDRNLDYDRVGKSPRSADEV